MASSNPGITNLDVEAQFPTADAPTANAATSRATRAAENIEAQRAGESYGDPSGKLWSMYLTEAEKQDKEITESWKGDTDGILVFTGLFSATVAAFIIESYKKLSPDSAMQRSHCSHKYLINLSISRTGSLSRTSRH
ncbi:hypothetical protein B0F90DRAFT_1849195 [Multifurca ochricompacta]|uniref:DUF6535 domain-containing protein n=1 Tax=Multifurca ochricompacta TaxID=376703 RepID=A0AAD4MAY6_9AGAM|nr:hypothetical protein B0F90DRAFT_1849195 [Multifurca ochricompacta]